MCSCFHVLINTFIYQSVIPTYWAAGLDVRDAEIDTSFCISRIPKGKRQHLSRKKLQGNEEKARASIPAKKQDWILTVEEIVSPTGRAQR